MKAVVIGGHSRNIGKTSLMAGLIRHFDRLEWTAVKITQYGHGICSLDANPCECAPEEHPFVLTEETNPRGRGDTCRFLAAGARRSLWLRVRQGQLEEAFPLLEQALNGNEWVMIESNSILGLLNPSLYLVVLDSQCRDFKPSAREFLSRADALVIVGPRFARSAWPALDRRSLEEKPKYFLRKGEYFSPSLARFVRKRLQLPESGLVKYRDSSE